MAQDARIVVDLLDRHSRVPSREEILERYVRTYQGRQVGLVGGTVGAEAAAGEPVEERDAGTRASAPAVKPPASGTPTSEMEAVTAPPEAPGGEREGAGLEGPMPDAVREPVAAEPDVDEDARPTLGMPVAGATPEGPLSAEAAPEEPLPALARPPTSEAAAPDEDEAADVDDDSGEDEATENPVAEARPSSRPGKKKKRKKRRGLGA